MEQNGVHVCNIGRNVYSKLPDSDNPPNMYFPSLLSLPLPPSLNLSFPSLLHLSPSPSSLPLPSQGRGRVVVEV